MHYVIYTVQTKPGVCGFLGGAKQQAESPSVFALAKGPFTLAIFAAILVAIFAAISSAISNRPCKLLAIQIAAESPVV